MLLLSSAALAAPVTAPVTQERPALLSTAKTQPFAAENEIATPAKVKVEFTKPVGYIEFFGVEPDHANANCQDHDIFHFRVWNKEPIHGAGAYPLRHVYVSYAIPETSRAFLSLVTKESKDHTEDHLTDHEGFAKKYVYSCFDKVQAISVQIHWLYSTETENTKKTVEGNFKYGPNSLIIDVKPKKGSGGASDPKGVKLTATVKNKTELYTTDPKHLIQGATVEFKLSGTAPDTMTLASGFTQSEPRKTVVTEQTNDRGIAEVTVLNSQPTSEPVEIEVSVTEVKEPESP